MTPLMSTTMRLVVFDNSISGFQRSHQHGKRLKHGRLPPVKHRRLRLGQLQQHLGSTADSHRAQGGAADVAGVIEGRAEVDALAGRPGDLGLGGGIVKRGETAGRLVPTSGDVAAQHRGVIGRAVHRYRPSGVPIFEDVDAAESDFAKADVQVPRQITPAVLQPDKSVRSFMKAMPRLS